MIIPVMKPKLANFAEVEKYLRRIDQTHIYSNRGPLVLELEDSYSNYLNVDKKLVVALSNATLAIQGLIAISRKRDWIVPDYTFPATGLAVLNANQTLHLCDVNLTDWKIDLSLITEEQKMFGIIPVMPFGAPIDFEPYKDFVDVIIDAAASLGSTPTSFSAMGKNWAVVYSLHATKVLGAGEGAIVVCGNQDQADRLRAWSNFGFLTSRSSEIQGTNAKMSEFNAAYGLFSLQNKEFEKSEWLKSQEYVASQARNESWMTYVNSSPQFHPYWIASFRDGQLRKLIAERLHREGIQTREWWGRPLSEQRAFSQSRVISQNKVANKLSSMHLGLPMYRNLQPNSVSKICELIKAGLED